MGRCIVQHGLALPKRPGPVSSWSVTLRFETFDTLDRIALDQITLKGVTHQHTEHGQDIIDVPAPGFFRPLVAKIGDLLGREISELPLMQGSEKGENALIVTLRA